jgi:hypothetical protein
MENASKTQHFCYKGLEKCKERQKGMSLRVLFICLLAFQTWELAFQTWEKLHTISW